MKDNRCNEAAQPADGLYHKDVNLPLSLVKSFIGQFRCDYEGHARRAALNDRYGLIDLPEQIAVEAQNVVEVEVRAGRIVKAVVRIAYDAIYDLVLPICRPCGGFAVVKTVWLNEKQDNHKTLRLSAYRHDSAVAA